MFSLTMYYVNCSLMLTVCNMWQFRYYLFFIFFYLLSINLANKDDYNENNDKLICSNKSLAYCKQNIIVM